MLHAARIAMLLSLVAIGTGCRGGLTCDFSASPDPANPGQSVKWNLSVRNDTQCTTTDDTLPPEVFPEGTEGAVAFFVGFAPELDGLGAEEVCRMFTNDACSDQSCVVGQLREALGPEIADSVRARMEAARSGSPLVQPSVGACEVLEPPEEGLFGACSFDPLAPGETDTAMLTAPAPDTGSREAAQLMVVYAPASGPDCRPGDEGSPGEWILRGCCVPGADTAAAPALSPGALVAGAVALLMIGVLGLYRRRRTS